MRAADLLIQTLSSLGNRYLFSLSGNQIMPIYDAWIDSDMELIHVRHEAAAVHMADAWGQLTETPGVALVTAGPGFAIVIQKSFFLLVILSKAKNLVFTGLRFFASLRMTKKGVSEREKTFLDSYNTLSALYDALMAESPVVLLSGHAPLKDLGHGPFQEMAQVEMAAPVTKASWMVQHPDEIGAAVQKAWRLAMDGRKGPVHLALPVDLLKAEVSQSEEETNNRLDNQSNNLSSTVVAQIAEAIRVAKRPLMLAGPAVMRSESFQNAQQMLKEANLPLVGMNNPRGIFEPSLGAFSSVLAEADLLLLLGKKLDFTLKMGQPPFIHPDARIIQVDHEAAVLELSQRNAHNRDLLLLEEGSPEIVLSLLNAEIQTHPPLAADWAAKVSNAISFRPAHWTPPQSSEGEALHPAEVGQAVDRFLAEGEQSLLIVDGGEFCHWIRAAVQSTIPKLTNGPAGSIGSVIPYALAARLAYPEARIVVCIGDGAFGFQPFELDTAVRYHLPFVLVVGNDACWNAEYQIQRRDYGANRIKGVDLLPTAYHEIAHHLGGWGCVIPQGDAGRSVDSAHDLDNALAAAHQSGLPACLNIMIKNEPAPKIRVRNENLRNLS